MRFPPLSTLRPQLVKSQARKSVLKQYHPDKVRQNFPTCPEDIAHEAMITINLLIEAKCGKPKQEERENPE